MTLNVLFVHGIGNHKKDYAQSTIEALREELGTRTADQIYWSSVTWGADMDSRQNHVMNRAIAGGDLDWQDMRREYIIGGLGDACAYLGDMRAQQAAMDHVEEAMDALPNQPTVVLCHSMGCAVMMDYLWYTDTPAQCAILFGCNLPLFWLAQRPGRLRLPQIDRVYNLYDSDDLLAYPLKNHSDQTQDWVTGDYRISTGTVLGAHTGYWTDGDFVSWVSKCLKRELRIVEKNHG